MTSRIGSNKKGFTLVEVMITTAVLSLGILFVYRALFTSLDAFSYYANYLRVVSWMDEKIWKVQDMLRRQGLISNIAEDKEELSISENKKFNWDLSWSLIDDKSHLFKIDLTLSWQEGSRRMSLSRTAYATYVPKE